ncbi:MAG: hypothetical protein Q8J89_02970 [Caulobacter sp.]|nr:hypothetical protein [Caulobacter sp.]
MSTTRRGLILTAAALAAAPGAAMAADDKKKPGPPLKKVFPYYDLYLGIPAAERSRFVMAYYLKVNGKPTSGQNLYVVMPGGARTLLTQAADGRVTRMPTLAEMKDGILDVDRKNPTDKFSVAMEMQPVVRLGETVATADLVAAIEQCNTAIRKRAGVIGFAVPKMEQVLFAGAGSGQSIAGDRVSPLPAFKAYVAFKPADHAGAQSLKFGKAPVRALLAGGKLKG